MILNLNKKISKDSQNGFESAFTLDHLEFMKLYLYAIIQFNKLFICFSHQ